MENSVHHDRMKEIGQVAIPREGTPEWHILQSQIKRNENNPLVKEYTKNCSMKLWLPAKYKS